MELAEDIYVVEKGLASEGFKESLMERLRSNCDSEITIKRLWDIATEIVELNVKFAAKKKNDRLDKRNSDSKKNEFLKIKPRFRRFLLGTGIVFVVLYLIRFGALLSSGSYPYAQEYSFEVPVKVLYDHVKKFKADNPEYDPSTKMNLKDDTFSSPGSFNIYLIYK